jgi:hypothetical protein
MIKAIYEHSQLLEGSKCADWVFLHIGFVFHCMALSGQGDLEDMSLAKSK